MLYTSYFANIRKLPENIIPISICGKAPDSWKGLQYKKLAPKWDFFKVWKETKDNDYYIKNFDERVLNVLNAENVVNDLYTLSNNKDVCLICYEKPSDFCHRHLVAEWLSKNGYECKEFQ
jgi:uncharacterized protein YeaO (DUF488 family)